MKTAWQIMPMGQLCSIKSGKSDTQDATEDGAYAFFDRSRTVKKSSRYIFDCEALIIPGEGKEFLPKYFIGKFDLHQRAYALFDFSNQIDVRFLYYFLHHKCDYFPQVAVGATVKSLRLRHFEQLPVSFTNTAEQQRIVAILDEAFAGIATAAANAKKNLANARELFDSEVQAILTKRGDGWADKTLDQVCIVERGSSPRPIKEFFTTAPDGVNWIKIGDTEEGGKYVYSTAQKITLEGAKQSRFVKEGDFILTNSMSYGRPYIMKTTGCIHDGWFVLRLNMEIDTDYFYYLLSSHFVQSQFAKLASGSVVKNISGDLVKMTVLPIPPLAHQHVIVTKLMQLSAETKQLEAIYQQKLDALDALKKSILHQAFSGQLH
jgi:type I restriction enzyme S subunit